MGDGARAVVGWLTPQAYPSGGPPSVPARRSAGLAQEQPAGVVVGLVRELIAQAVQQAMERPEVRAGYLDAQQDAPEVGAMVSVVEQADVPAGAHALEEVEQCARPLREHDLEQPLVVGAR